jgi:hypothetical protein
VLCSAKVLERIVPRPERPLPVGPAAEGGSLAGRMHPRRSRTLSSA